MPWLPRKKFNEWPADAVRLSASKVRELYESGFAGCKKPTDKVLAAFYAAAVEPDGDKVCHAYGLAESGAGKLVVPFVHVLEMFPGCWPGRQGQGRGDCVSWGTRNASLGTMVCDIVSGQLDQVSGKAEEKPDVPAGGIADGVLSTEAFYWWRGYNGDGWYCHAAATVAKSKSGLFVRKPYPDLGVDLTSYSSSLAGKYGAKVPTPAIATEGGKHLIHQITEAASLESRRDLLANGYFLLDCGGEGYEDQRNEHGVSKRSGSWAHSMCEIAVDDRQEIKAIYNEPLVLILNSWAKWNGGPRDIYQSAALVPPAKKALWVQAGIVNPTTGNIMIPEGSYWARWSHVKNREAIAMSGAHGWPRKNIDNMLL